MLTRASAANSVSPARCAAVMADVSAVCDALRSLCSFAATPTAWKQTLAAAQSPAICASRLHSTSAIPAQEAPMHLVAPRTVGSKRHLEPRLEAAQQLRQLPNSGRAQRGPQLAEVQPPHFGRVALGYQVVSGRVRRQEVRQPTTRHVGCCAHVPSCRSPRAVAHVTVPAKPDET